MSLSNLDAGERQLMRLVARGLSDREIAARLIVSEADAGALVGRLISTLGLRDRSRVVILAYECGLVTPSAAPQDVVHALLSDRPPTDS